MYVIIIELVGRVIDVELRTKKSAAVDRAKEIVADKMTDATVFRPEITNLPFFASMPCVGTVRVLHREIIK